MHSNLDLFFQTVQNHAPVAFAVCLLVVRAVLIDREKRFTLFRAEFKRDGVIVFRAVRQTGEAAPIEVGEALVGYDFENLALVLVLLALPRAPEVNQTSRFPVGLNFSAEKILLDEFRLGQMFPDLRDGSVQCD